MKRRFARAVLVGPAALASAAALPTSTAHAQSTWPSFSITTGVDYSSGGYGIDEKTKILVVPISARVVFGQLRLLATLPYLRIDSPGTVFGGVNGNPVVVDPGTPMGREVREGLGDLSLGATYALSDRAIGGFDVDLGARVKFPTSERDEALGTGEIDSAFSVDISRSIGNWAPFLTVGYRILGDPEGWRLRDGFTTSVGTSIILGKAVAIASYDYSRSNSRFVDDAHELFGAVSLPTTERLNWTAYGTVGLSEGSPDLGVGLLLSLKL